MYGSSENYRELLSDLQVYKFFHEHSDPAYAEYYANEDYTIGAAPLQIDSITWKATEGAYELKGSGFTENVWLCVNDVRLKDKSNGFLEYVDANTMILRNYKGTLSSKDRLVLQVVGEKYGEVLKTSPVFTPSD